MSSEIDTWPDQESTCSGCGEKHAWAFYYVLKRAGDEPWITWNDDGTFNIHRFTPRREWRSSKSASVQRSSKHK